jgi:hypothetical protein
VLRGFLIGSINVVKDVRESFSEEGMIAMLKINGKKKASEKATGVSGKSLLAKEKHAHAYTHSHSLTYSTFTQ